MASGKARTRGWAIDGPGPGRMRGDIVCDGKTGFWFGVPHPR